jgi:hypothetical protein
MAANIRQQIEIKKLNERNFIIYNFTKKRK